jgi:hypothetical protein
VDLSLLYGHDRAGTSWLGQGKRVGQVRCMASFRGHSLERLRDALKMKSGARVTKRCIRENDNFKCFRSGARRPAGIPHTDDMRDKPRAFSRPFPLPLQRAMGPGVEPIGNDKPPTVSRQEII